MVDTPKSNAVRNDAISLRDFLADVRELWFALAAVVVICGVAGAVIGLLGTREYEATVVVVPAESNTGSGSLGAIGGLVSDYAALGSLVGVSLPGTGNRGELIGILQSDLLTQSYVHDNNLLPVLFARDWDATTQQWKKDLEAVPTLWGADRLFKAGIRSITDNSKTGLINLRVRWTDPKLAATWANGLVASANAYLKEKAIRESERSIVYLKQQAASTSLVEMQQAINGLLQQQLNQEMLARGRDEYALRVVDPAFPPERPVTRGPKFMAAEGLVLGLFLALAVVFVRRLLRAI